MFYQQPVYRPPSEAGSLLIQATIGCPHNKCTFCGMYKGTNFRIRKVADIKNDIRDACDFYGSENVRTIFFPDGNTIIIKTRQLCEILTYSEQLFPNLSRITVYGSAKFALLKSPHEWQQIYKAGLKRVHMGLETGDAQLLTTINKGATPEQIIKAGNLIKNAGIQLSLYVLMGIGGKKHSERHALATAQVLNAINPEFIRLRTWVPVSNAPLYRQYQSGDFQLLSPHETLRETKTLLQELEVDSHFLSDHISNYANLNGKLPEAKQQLLSYVDRSLQLSSDYFRNAVIEHL